MMVGSFTKALKVSKYLVKANIRERSSFHEKRVLSLQRTSSTSNPTAPSSAAGLTLDLTSSFLESKRRNS